MTELKTKPGSLSVDSFINAIENDKLKNDCFELIEIFRKTVDAEPVIWGTSIIGFGNYHYHYKSGREGDWFIAGFSPRKNAISIYLVHGFETPDNSIGSLGKFKTGKGCIYIKQLNDINSDVLIRIIEFNCMKNKK